MFADESNRICVVLLFCSVVLNPCLGKDVPRQRRVSEPPPHRAHSQTCTSSPRWAPTHQPQPNPNSHTFPPAHHAPGPSSLQNQTPDPTFVTHPSLDFTSSSASVVSFFCTHPPIPPFVLMFDVYSSLPSSNFQSFQFLPPSMHPPTYPFSLAEHPTPSCRFHIITITDYLPLALHSKSGPRK